VYGSGLEVLRGWHPIYHCRTALPAAQLPPVRAPSGPGPSGTSGHRDKRYIERLALYRCGRLRKAYDRELMDDHEVERGIEEGRLIVDERLKRFFAAWAVPSHRGLATVGLTAGGAAPPRGAPRNCSSSSGIRSTSRPSGCAPSSAGPGRPGETFAPVASAGAPPGRAQGRDRGDATHLALQARCSARRARQRGRGAGARSDAPKFSPNRLKAVEQPWLSSGDDLHPP
jgi:hypothetical protein